MGHRRTAITLFSGAAALSSITALLTVGGVAQATQQPATSTRAVTLPATSKRSAQNRATLHAAKATVNGKSESILEDAAGFPLYYYQRDTAKKSQVTGYLAVLWPPLVSASPTESGAGGSLSILKDANGRQVAYNGHFLYTFADDVPGQVRGQGVEDFFVATPQLKQIGASSSASASTSTTSGGYGY